MVIAGSILAAGGTGAGTGMGGGTTTFGATSGDATTGSAVLAGGALLGGVASAAPFGFGSAGGGVCAAAPNAKEKTIIHEKQVKNVLGLTARGLVFIFPISTPPAVLPNWRMLLSEHPVFSAPRPMA
jgi:hypothetical protein